LLLRYSREMKFLLFRYSREMKFLHGRPREPEKLAL